MEGNETSEVPGTSTSCDVGKELTQKDSTSQRNRVGRPKGSSNKRRGPKTRPGVVQLRRRLTPAPKGTRSSRKVAKKETALTHLSTKLEVPVPRNTAAQTFDKSFESAVPCINRSADVGGSALKHSLQQIQDSASSNALKQINDTSSESRQVGTNLCENPPIELLTCEPDIRVSTASTSSVLSSPYFHDLTTFSSRDLSSDSITPFNLPSTQTAHPSALRDSAIQTSPSTTAKQTASSPNEIFTVEAEDSFNKSDLLKKARSQVEFMLDSRWRVILNPDGLQVVMLPAQDNSAIQRNVVCSSRGEIDLFVHRQQISVNHLLKKVPRAVPLFPSSLNTYVARLLMFVNEVNRMEVCSGCDDEDCKIAWNWYPEGEIDRNPYNECRFTETFRSLSCSRLVKMSTWRCAECNKLYRSMKKRSEFLASDNPHPNTPNVFLGEEQRLKKLHEQAVKLNNAKRQISHLGAKTQTLIGKEGVAIDTELSDSFIEIMRSNAITRAQSIFLQEQIKASEKSKGMRWHPTMIRLALSLHVTSPAAYEMLRNTGMVKLPFSRTLFDYGRVKPIEEGIDMVVLESLGKTASNFEHEYQKYHVLMTDEMHISHNLVFQKSTGQMVGFTNLDNVGKEVENLENFLNNVAEEEQEPSVAQKVLLYMVKGVSSGIKEVVATYAVGNISVSQMYSWTWEVIGALERSGIAVICFVSDGFSVNRAFIKMHHPVTILPNGVIFDTINKAAPHRVLYFLSDVPHLLKTIRNCLYNSRNDRRKSRRHMKFKGKDITWDFIIKLYESNEKKNLRKSFKLNAMNVYPDSYAQMEVKLAGQVLSRTVAQDLEDQDWSEASELIYFIRFVNDWFDCLNGAHTSVGKKEGNDNLLAYTEPDDKRFEYLLSFLDYLQDWTEEATNTNISMNAPGTLEKSMRAGDSIIGTQEEGVDPLEDATPASNNILSRQTLEGVEITTRAFISMVKFLLGEGTQFINARVFTQDPLEQHFSKMRAGQGESNNHNIGLVISRNRALHTVGKMGVKRRIGNCGESAAAVQVTEEPLPKSRNSRVPCEDFK